MFTLIALAPTLTFVALLMTACFIRRDTHLSSVVIYHTDHSTRYLTTAKLNDKDRRKFLRHIFGRYDVKFVEVDGKPYYARGNHVESL